MSQSHTKKISLDTLKDRNSIKYEDLIFSEHNRTKSSFFQKDDGLDFPPDRPGKGSEMIMTLFKSLIFSLTDYYYVLMSPFRAGDTVVLETVQRPFTAHNETASVLNYRGRLEH